MRRVLLLAGVLVLGFCVWLAAGGFGEAPAPAGPLPPVGTDPTPQPEQPSVAPTPLPEARSAVAVADEDAFVSESEDDGVIAKPVRDGVTMLVLDGDRRPMPNAKVDVRWRKGWGMYGNDRGRTDANGRFVTTVPMHEMLDGFTLLHPEHGELEYYDLFLPLANEPRTVMMFVPKLVSVRVLVRGTDGVAIGRAKVKGQVHPPDHAPREHPLLPYHPAGITDDHGRLTLAVLPSEVRFEVEADGFQPVGKTTAEIGPEGLDLLLLMQKTQVLHEVLVTVQVPEGMAPEVSAWAHADPPQLPVIPGVSYSDTQRQFAVRRRDATHFVVHAEPVSWKLSMHGKEFEWSSVPVAPTQTDVVVVMKRATKPPMAKLKCRILLPDGTPTSGEVMVHETPDLVYGSKVQTQYKQGHTAIVEREAKGKVCVSAWVYRYPIAVAGPIELTVGEHEVVLQLERPQSIRGRVVDADGKPVKAHVNVLRPAGVFQRLTEGVPAILPHSANGDTLGTLDDGAFWFEHLGAGEHELQVRADRFGWPGSKRVQPGEQDIVVRLGDGIEHLAKVEGRITRAGTDAGAAGEVWLKSEPYTNHVYVGADGRFRITAPPGRYTLEAVSLRCAYMRQGPRDLAAGFATWDLVATSCEPLFVRVTDAAGAPVKDVEVMAFDAEGNELNLVDAMGRPEYGAPETSKTGRIGLGGLPDVAIKLVFEKDGRRQELPVAAGTPRANELEVVWKSGS